MWKKYKKIIFRWNVKALLGAITQSFFKEFYAYITLSVWTLRWHSQKPKIAAPFILSLVMSLVLYSRQEIYSLTNRQNFFYNILREKSDKSFNDIASATLWISKKSDTRETTSFTTSRQVSKKWVPWLDKRTILRGRKTSSSALWIAYSKLPLFRVFVRRWHHISGRGQHPQFPAFGGDKNRGMHRRLHQHLGLQLLDSGKIRWGSGP